MSRSGEGSRAPFDDQGFALDVAAVHDPQIPPLGAALLEVLDGMIEQQRAKVLATARRVVPHLTADDVMNPHDFPALAASAEFQYEDGILAGYLGAQMALRAHMKKGSDPIS